MFNTEGEFLLKFGSNGEGNGQFNAPTGVAVDVNGNIIVADWGNSRIQVSTGSLTLNGHMRSTLIIHIHSKYVSHTKSKCRYIDKQYHILEMCR